MLNYSTFSSFFKQMSQRRELKRISEACLKGCMGHRKDEISLPAVWFINAVAMLTHWKWYVNQKDSQSSFLLKARARIFHWIYTNKGGSNLALSHPEISHSYQEGPIFSAGQDEKVQKGRGVIEAEAIAAASHHHFSYVLSLFLKKYIHWFISKKKTEGKR